MTGTSPRHPHVVGVAMGEVYERHACDATATGIWELSWELGKKTTKCQSQSWKNIPGNWRNKSCFSQVWSWILKQIHVFFPQKSDEFVKHLVHIPQVRFQRTYFWLVARDRPDRQVGGAGFLDGSYVSWPRNGWFHYIVFCDGSLGGGGGAYMLLKLG